MSDLELEQVRLQLTTDPEILGALKARKQMGKDADGPYFPVVFNSQELRFRPGVPKILGASVARCVARSTYIIVGDDLTGEMRQTLEALDSYNLNDLVVANQTCEFCDGKFETPKRLAAHMVSEHRDQLDPAGLTVTVPATPAKVALKSEAVKA